MNLQHLKHFVAVAEELHFGRAAERIGMAQPPLSQSIRRLEDSLGSRLFLRTRRRVELTPAGEALLQHARDILHQVEFAERAVQRARENGVATLTIGFTPNLLSDIVPAAMREMRRLAPGVEITLWEGLTTEQIPALLNGAIDVGFFNPHDLQIKGLEVRVVEHAALVAAVPKGSPLAEKAELTLRDLGDQTLLLFPARHRPEIHQSLANAFRKAGVAPRISQEATFDLTRLQLVAADMGVTLVSETVVRQGYPGVVVRQVRDLPAELGIKHGMAWRRNAALPIRRLLATIFETIKRD